MDDGKDADVASLLKDQGGLKGLWETAINSVIRPPRHDAEPQSSVPLTCFFAKGGVRDRQPWANAVAEPRQALLAQGL
jgi:hypothetical protein